MGGMGTSPPSPSALFGPLWSWLSWCSGNPTEGLVGRGPCLDSLSTGLLPLCWPEGPCSQKPGQTPQVRCAAAVPAAERRGVRKRRKGCPLGAQHGPTALFMGGGPTALFRVVTELSTILRMSASPFLCPGAAAFHGGQVSVSTGSASPQNWVIAMTCSLLGRPGG